MSWYLANEPGSWTHRVAITYSNAGGATTGLQVNIVLDNTFDYAACLAGGVDMRVTDSNGTTVLPYYIESFTSPTSASIWFKVNVPDASNHTAYLYYGNASGTPVAPAATPTPPLGPFTHSDTFMVPTGGPAGSKIIPENMLLVGSTYYMVFEDRTASPATIGMAHTTDPSVTTGWTWDSTVISIVSVAANSPFLCKIGSTYYIIIWRGDTNSIYLYSASAVTGPYTSLGEILPVGGVGTWDHVGVFEPCLVQNFDGNGNFLLLYTGSTSAIGVGDERIGYATASTITGPWTKYASNPILPFGAAGSVDTKYTADSWVVDNRANDGLWYVGYTGGSATGASGYLWGQCAATTTDWITFTRHSGRMNFAPGVAGNVPADASARWDCYDAHRGHPLVVGTKWVQAYCGANVLNGTLTTGIMTAPASAVQDIRNNADFVFDFWDGFDDASLNLNKWSVTPNAASGISLSASVLDIATPAVNSTFYAIASSPAFGSNTVLEASARYKTANSNSSNACEICFAQGDLNGVGNINGWRVVTYDNANFRNFKTVNGASTLATIASAPIDSASFHKVQIYWAGTTATMNIDAHTSTATGSFTNNQMQAVIGAFDFTAAAEIMVDWIRIRQWPSNESVVSVGAEQTSPVGGGDVQAGNSISGCQAWTDEELYSTGVTQIGSEVN